MTGTATNWIWFGLPSAASVVASAATALSDLLKRIWEVRVIAVASPKQSTVIKRNKPVNRTLGIVVPIRLNQSRETAALGFDLSQVDASS